MRRPFLSVIGRAAPIDRSNVNTDMIFPARFLKAPRAPGYEKYLFHDLRFTPDGAERADFILNRPFYRGAPILVADSNFGCGSSRETAVYALEEYGVRAVVAPSFGDIFAANCVQNGIVPVRLAPAAASAIRRQLFLRPGAELTVDLDELTVRDVDGASHGFAMETQERECLMRGLDEVDITLEHRDAIETFDRTYRERYPWFSIENREAPAAPRRTAVHRKVGE